MVYCRSREGAWIEIQPKNKCCNSLWRRSRKGAWIEIMTKNTEDKKRTVAPARERGLKLVRTMITNTSITSRSRKGAWIEMALASAASLTILVAPARERGLKCEARSACAAARRRSRKGAWIEMRRRRCCAACVSSLPEGSVD